MQIKNSYVIKSWILVDLNIFFLIMYSLYVLI